MLKAADMRAVYRRVHALAGRHSPQADLVYLFGQTAANEASVLDAATRFQEPIGLVGHDSTEASGYPGYSRWRTSLIERGVSEERIVPITESFFYDDTGAFRGNTLTEARALVNYAREHEIRTVTIVATYWHLVRCFVSTVGMALKDHPTLRVYPVRGGALSWDETVPHSQGRVMGTRADLVAEEIFRLFEYSEEVDIDGIKEANALVGALPDPRLVLEYLEQL